jgi:predicted ATP-dependent endonuclease of OLD family
MFHLQSLELLHWDYCQRVTLPLDGAIITIAGPNGSGKTTLLDAMRTLLGPGVLRRPHVQDLCPPCQC